MKLKTIVTVARILAIICLLVYSGMCGAMGYSFSDNICKIILLAGGVFLIVSAVVGLIAKSNKPD